MNTDDPTGLVICAPVELGIVPTDPRAAQDALVELGLPEISRSPTPDGAEFVRYDAGGVTLKLVCMVEPPALSDGYAGLLVPERFFDRGLSEALGVPFEPAPWSDDGVGFVVRGNDAVALHSFWGEMLGLQRAEPDGYEFGRARVQLRAGPNPARAWPRDRAGLRYVTAIVPDLDGAHARLLKCGVRFPIGPTAIGTNRMAMAVDPSGHWIELGWQPLDAIGGDGSSDHPTATALGK